MGGNLAWTVRRSDGTEYRMDRWTNAMSELVTNPAFFQEDEDHLATCLESWLAMKEDWEKNQGTGNYEKPMTEAYAPYPYGCKPSEYGIVVTDFMNKVILTNQNYCSFNEIDLHWLKGGDRHVFERMNPDRYANIMGFVDAGLVREYSYFAKTNKAVEHLLAVPGAYVFDKDQRDPSFKGPVEVCLPGNIGIDRLEDILTVLPKDVRGDLLMGRAILDTTPFTVEEFKPTSEGWTKMLERVRELDFFLSDEEVAAWEARIAYELENEAEDA